MKSRYPFRHPEVEAVLAELHRAAGGDRWRLAPRIPQYLWLSLRNRLYDAPGQHPMFRDVFSAVTEERGALLYLIARANQAKRVVEFGSSFGISTIYLATAVRDNVGKHSDAGAQVIGTEMEPEKCAEATRNLEKAGLSGIARILLGNALETLATMDGSLDFVFLDGRKDLYLPVLKLLKPKLRNGAVIVADNIDTFRKDVAPFIEYVQSGKNGFASSTLKISDGIEFSVFQQTGE